VYSAATQTRPLANTELVGSYRECGKWVYGYHGYVLLSDGQIVHGDLMICAVNRLTAQVGALEARLRDHDLPR